MPNVSAFPESSALNPEKEPVSPITAYNINVPELLKSLKDKSLKATLRNRGVVELFFSLIKEQGFRTITRISLSLATQSIINRGN